MSTADAHFEGDPLAQPLEDVPRTVEYLRSLREEVIRARHYDPERVLASAERGRLIAEEMGADEFIASFLVSTAFYWIQRRDYDMARQALETADHHAALVGGPTGEELRMRIANQRGEVHLWEGDFADARRHFLDALEIARMRDDREWQAALHDRLAVTYKELSGDFRSAVEHATEALRICPKDDLHVYGSVLFDLALIALSCGDLVTARAYCDELLSDELRSVFEPIPERAAVIFGISAMVADEEGRSAEALSLSNRSVEEAREAFDQTVLAEALIGRSAILYRTNLLDAVRDLEEALTLTSDDVMRAQGLVSLARASAAIATGRLACDGPSLERLGGPAIGEGIRQSEALDRGAERRARELLAQVEELVPVVPPNTRWKVILGIAETRMFLGDHSEACSRLVESRNLEKELFTATVRNEIGSIRLLLKLEREEHEREILRMKTEKAERELGNATLQLLAQTELLAELRSDLLKIARKIAPTEPAARELRERVKRLPCESVDWEKFDAQFREVHPEFVRALTDRAPDLTPTEVRICAMVRMNLKSIEIAQIFCTTEKGVEFHRTNIRRKLKMRREEKLPIVLGVI